MADLSPDLVHASKEIKFLTKRRHPRYLEMLPHWTFLEECYYGGRKWFNSRNIFKYLKEGEKEYADRLERAYRFNHSREVVDLVNKYLFRTNINRKQDAPECLQKFWKKATLSGLDINEFMQVASTKSSIFGRTWIIVDSDVVTSETTTQADLDKFHGPYAYVVRPQDVVDLSFDDYGILNWILVREFTRDDDDPHISTGDIEERYRLWTRTTWHLYGRVIKSGRAGKILEEIKGGTHGLGIVPAVPNDNSFTMDPYSVPSLIADIAYLDRACANYASNLDAIVQDQTFSQLAMPAQGVLPGEDAYDKLLEMGTKRVFLYDGENGNQPVFLSPDPKQAALIISAIGQLINEIYHSVGLAGERTKQDNAKGIDNSSGVAKTKDFERVLALLSAKATCLETVENKLARLVCLWNGDEDEASEELVSYSEDFDIKGLAEEIETLVSILSINAPATVLSEQMKVLIKKLFPQMGEVQINKILDEAESWANEQKENFALGTTASVKTGGLLEEARRDRADAGEKQSQTKQRETVA